MANHYTNYYQETPAQLKRQAERLKSCRNQWLEFEREKKKRIKKAKQSGVSVEDLCFL